MEISEEQALMHVKCLEGFRVSRVWRGYGSALFIELGELTNDGRSSKGEFTVMIEWSWRLEDSKNIVVGSWSDNELIDVIKGRMEGLDIMEVSFFSRLRELELRLSGGFWLCSFATAEGNPEWSVRGEGGIWVSYVDGEFRTEDAQQGAEHKSDSRGG